jgi:hypothetical protein
VLTTAAVLHPLLLLLFSQLEFPDPSSYFVTGTKGFFGGLAPSLACPNQWSNNNTPPVTSIDLPFTVGCNAFHSDQWSAPAWALLPEHVLQLLHK